MLSLIYSRGSHACSEPGSVHPVLAEDPGKKRREARLLEFDVWPNEDNRWREGFPDQASWVVFLAFTP